MCELESNIFFSDFVALNYILRDWPREFYVCSTFVLRSSTSVLRSSKPQLAHPSLEKKQKETKEIEHQNIKNIKMNRHSLTIGFDSVTITKNKKLQLEGCTGLVHGGRLTAIISCCGTRGDYYLLNALAGQETCTSGHIVANGVPVMGAQYRQGAALIDEDLTTFEELTVRQNLQYSASMRMAQFQDDDIDAVLEVLDLEVIQRREMRKCSPFARRRVKLGKELVLNPFAIFVDGAVQGLATHEARQYLLILRHIAVAGNRVVCVSMVQPRWPLLELVDDVILIEGQSVAFSGTTRELLAVVQLNESQLPESSLNAIYRAATNPKASLVTIFEPSNSRQITANNVQEFFTECASGHLSLDSMTNRGDGQRRPPYSAVKLVYLFQSSVRQVGNNIIAYSLFTGFLLVVSVILGAVYKGQSGQSGMQNRIGIIFFLISCTFLTNILFVDQRLRMYQSFLRHRAHGYFGPATYLIYWVLTSAFLRFFGTSVFTVVVYSLANIESSWDLTSLRDLVGIVAFTSFSTSVVVLFVCTIVTSARVAHFILFGIYTLNVILGGIVLNVNTLPTVFQFLSFASHIRLGYESAILTQFQGQDFGCSTSPEIHQNTTNACYTGDQYLRFLGFHPDRKWENVGLMAYMSLGLILCCYAVMLLWKTPRKITN